MERRIRFAALVASVVAIALFALPLALVAHQRYVTDAYDTLEKTALRAAVAIDPVAPTGDSPDLISSPAGTAVAFYDAVGRRIDGTGPARADAIVATSLLGEVGRGRMNGNLVVAIPVSAGESVRGAVRAERSAADVWSRTIITTIGMLLLALFALLASVLVARSLARRINQPLEALALASQQLGDGDFSTRAVPSGIPEIDRAGTALNDTAQRLGELVHRERTFAANASHQLRTPLTGLRLQLERSLDASPPDLRLTTEAAIDSADELERTINDLLAHVHDPVELSVHAPVDLREALSDLEHRWHSSLAADGRRLIVHIEPTTPDPVVAPYALRQALDVLVDNANTHGSGTVTVRCRELADAIAIDVSDEGPGIRGSAESLFERGQSAAPGHGIGLPMARELIQASGGRLVLSRSRPGARFTLLLLAAPE